MVHRVLVVDDQPDLRMLLRMHLEVDGFDVVGEAEDAASALAQTELLQPQAVVLDQQLPDGRGTDLVGPLRAVSPGLRVILYAGDPTDEAMAMEAGADGFVGKGEPLSRLSALLAD